MGFARAGGHPAVGWVERSETHRVLPGDDGFRHSASKTRVNALMAQPILQVTYASYAAGACFFSLKPNISQMTPRMMA
jgi:hypothetical protein